MWEEILLMRGTINKINNDEINEEIIFQLLKDNGYDFVGTFETVNFKDVSNAAKRIDEFITEEILQNMINNLIEHYGEMNNEEVELFFNSNFGTSVFSSLFESVLNEELREVFNKYNDTNWQIADEFGGLLGEDIMKKLNKSNIL